MGTSRRRLLRTTGLAAFLAACERALPVPSSEPTPTPTPTPASPSPSPVATSPSPTPAGPRPVLIRAAALADGTSASAVRDVVVVLRGERIEYAGARSGAPDVRDAEVVDLPALTVIPAMVDCHVHLTGSGGTSAHASLQDPDDVLLARAEANARLAARSGVLAVRDVGAVAARSGNDLRATNIQARDALRGANDAPYIAAAGCWLSKRGRYAPFAVQVDTAEQLLAEAIAQLDAGADLVKLAADYTTGSVATWSADELRPVVEAVHARGKKVAAHAQGHGSRAAAEAGADTVEHGFVVDTATAAVMKARGTTLVTSLAVARAFGQLAIAVPSIKAAHAAGVTIATGTDAGGAPPVFGDFAQEVELLVGAGLGPHQALAAATRSGGQVLGVPGLGTLGAGAPADLVLIDGDPLSDPRALRRVRAVFRSGRRLA